MKPVSWQSVEDCCELYAYNESPVFSSVLNKKNNFNQNLKGCSIISNNTTICN
jgi:hypothetical protein